MMHKLDLVRKKGHTICYVEIEMCAGKNWKRMMSRIKTNILQELLLFKKRNHTYKNDDGIEHVANKHFKKLFNFLVTMKMKIENCLEIQYHVSQND